MTLRAAFARGWREGRDRRERERPCRALFILSCPPPFPPTPGILPPVPLTRRYALGAISLLFNFCVAVIGCFSRNNLRLLVILDCVLSITNWAWWLAGAIYVSQLCSMCVPQGCILLCMCMFVCVCLCVPLVCEGLQPAKRLTLPCPLFFCPLPAPPSPPAPPHSTLFTPSPHSLALLTSPLTVYRGVLKRPRQAAHRGSP
jgi:hypothetical protein